MYLEALNIIYYSLLIVGTIMAIRYWYGEKFSKHDLAIVTLLLFSFICECAAYFMAIAKGNNYFTYNISVVGDYILTMSYFFQILFKYKIGRSYLLLPLILFGLIVGAFRTLRSPDALEISFLFGSGIVLTIMGCYVLWCLVKTIMHKSPFWTISLLVFNNAAPLPVLMLYPFLDELDDNQGMIPDMLLLAVNIITLAGLIFVFFKSTKSISYAE